MLSTLMIYENMLCYTLNVYALLYILDSRSKWQLGDQTDRYLQVVNKFTGGVSILTLRNWRSQYLRVSLVADDTIPRPSGTV